MKTSIMDAARLKQQEWQTKLPSTILSSISSVVASLDKDIIILQTAQGHNSTVLAQSSLSMSAEETSTILGIFDQKISQKRAEKQNIEEYKIIVQNEQT